MHQPLLETYGSIRRVPNISLVVGSGFGDAEETLKYLTGSWSTEFDYAPMPVDGILFGSRVMVAKEALTSQTVKELIVATPGLTDEADWEKTYKGQAGGIITVKSELGEPIHKIANRGMKLWKEVDDIIFSLPKEKRVKELLAKKDYLIQRLNQDFQKVWFGMKSSTGKPCDLIEMTYKEVAERLFELLYIKKEGVWIDATHRNIFGDFLRRLEERFIGTDSSSSGMKNHEQSLLQAYEDLDDSPEDFLSAFIECFPGATVQTLTQEDVFHFLSICSMPVRKPVPFIPVFDDKFEFWFKKDSLWQADRLEAVIDEDAQRVAILQGPVAVRHSNIVNEPVGEIMGNIYSGHISAIKKLYYKDSLENVPVVQYLGVTSSVKSAISSRLKGVSTTHLKGLAEESSVMHELSRKESELPALDDYLEFIAGGKPNWLRALLCSDSIVRDNLLVINPIKSVLRPRVSQTVMITGKHEEPLVLTVHDQSSAQSQIPSRHAAVVISFDSDKITVEMHEKCSGSSSGFASLKFFFRYERRQGYNPIHEITEVKLYRELML